MSIPKQDRQACFYDVTINESIYFGTGKFTDAIEVNSFWGLRDAYTVYHSVTWGFCLALPC